MRIDVFTIFPGMVEHFADQSLLGRAHHYLMMTNSYAFFRSCRYKSNSKRNCRC